MVIFDLDHTLLTQNSSFRFGFYLFRRHFFSFWTLLHSLSDYARHKWFGMSLHELHAKSFDRIFKGKSLPLIGSYVNSFLDLHLCSMLYLPAISRLKEAQTKGDFLIILSSSPDFLVREIAKRLNVNEWEATTYQTDSRGCFISLSKVKDGEDKAISMKCLTSKMNLPLSAVTVYSDSHLDLPLLKIAGKSIGVAPTRQLKRICLENGWEII